MGTGVNAFIDKIVADAEKKIRTDLKEISSQAKKDFVQRAKETVTAYYIWKPRVYQRTDNLKDNVVNENISFTILNGNGYEAWVQFNSDEMSDYDMGSKDVVVSNFMYGIHGRPSVFVESIPALKLMDDFQDGYKKILDGYFINKGYAVN